MMPWYLNLPSVETCLANDQDFLCSLPGEFESDGDIAGPGVFCAFVISASLALLAGLFGLGYEGMEYGHHSGSKHRHAQRVREFVDVFLISLGDTQIVTSIALVVIVNSAVGCTISAYHYDLVCKLVLISSASHIGSIAFVHKYFARSIVLGAIRVVLIVLSLGFSWSILARRSFSPIFPRAKSANTTTYINDLPNTGLVLPASCYIEHPGVGAATSHSNFTSSQYWSLNITGTVATNSTARFGATNSSMFFGNETLIPNFEPFSSNDVLSDADMIAFAFVTVALVFTLFGSGILGCYSRKDKQGYTCRHWLAYGFRVASYLVVCGVMIYGTIVFKILQNWMKGSNWFGDDDGESAWRSFGQLMPLMLLVLPILAVVEEYCGQNKSSQEKDGQESDSYGDKDEA